MLNLDEMERGAPACLLATALVLTGCGGAPAPATRTPTECPAATTAADLVAVAKFEGDARLAVLARAGDRLPEGTTRAALATELLTQCPTVRRSAESAVQLRDRFRDLPGDLQDVLVLDGTLDAIRDDRQYDVVTLSFHTAGAEDDSGVVLAFFVDRATTRVVLVVRLLEG